MLMLRLQRIGRRNEAHFKIVVIEKTKGPKSQKYVDIVGSYNPKMGTVIMDNDKVTKWLSNGVQPSDTVYNMLVEKGLVEGRKKNNLPKKSPVIDHEAIAKAEEEARLAAEKKAQEEAAAAEAAQAEAEASTEEVAEEPAADVAETVETPSADELETAQEQAPEETTEKTEA